MPIGVLVDCLATALGGLLGAVLGSRLPEKLKEFLPLVFSICCLGIGISLIIQAVSLTAVMLAIILGSIVGALIDIDNIFKRCVYKVQSRLTKSSNDDMHETMSSMLSLIVLFCFGTTTILGSLTEGLSGDASILVMKAVLDFFTAMIFACSLKYIVALVAIPQFVVCTLFFYWLL